jgi:hypothetical protein
MYSRVSVRPIIELIKARLEEIRVRFFNMHLIRLQFLQESDNLSEINSIRFYAIVLEINDHPSSGEQNRAKVNVFESLVDSA